MIVAIDGPAGAGKSSVARGVAQRLGFLHMDTGAMYRTLTVAFLDRGLDVRNRAAVDATVRSIEMSLEDGRIKLDGVDVTGRVRDSDVTKEVSLVAAEPAVRAALIPLQRMLAEGRNIVVEGRDIASVVFPDAEVKIYLTASPEERAARRAAQLGIDMDRDGLDCLRREIRVRDERDATRAVSPLQRTATAELIDSTDLPLAEVIERVATIADQRRGST